MAKPGSIMKTVQPKTYPSDRGKIQCIVEVAAAAFWLTVVSQHCNSHPSLV